jgi:heat shock protein HslJ
VSRCVRVAGFATIAPRGGDAADEEEQAMAFKRERLRSLLSIVWVGLAIALVLAACGGSATPAPTTSAAAGGSASPLDGKWVLTKYTPPGGNEQTVPAALTPSIEFQGDAATGNAGCNTYQAIVSTNGNQIRFTGVGSTKIACPPPGSVVEAAFLQALNLSTEYKVEGNTLTISAPGNQPPSLVFIRAA